MRITTTFEVQRTADDEDVTGDATCDACGHLNTIRLETLRRGAPWLCSACGTPIEVTGVVLDAGPEPIRIRLRGEPDDGSAP